MRKLIILIVVLIVILGLVAQAQKYVPGWSKFISDNSKTEISQKEQVKIASEESVTINIVKTAGASVVTVAEESEKQVDEGAFFAPGQNPFFGLPIPDQFDEQQPAQPRSIGSGFIISTDGMIVTNKHVVSNTQIKYFIITSADKKYTVEKIYRDPINDVAIMKIDLDENAGDSIKPVALGNSSDLQVGQYAAAIGTALGEFRNTVTTGIISGLGRGITAGSPYEGFVERLDNVIQTDAAINPGNSGGPLLNSSGQVIGVSTAISSSGQNIGFAIPINVIKDSLKNFNQTGQFNRPYLGVAYRIISKDIAILNDVPEGAYVQNVVSGSAAEKAGLKKGDIIIKLNGERIDQDHQLSSVIGKRRVGERIKISIYRNGSISDMEAVLESATDQ